LQVDRPAPQDGAAEEIEVVLCAAVKAARAVTRRKRMLNRLRSIEYKNVWKKKVL
jgi:hypothetical protein